MGRKFDFILMKIRFCKVNKEVQFFNEVEYVEYNFDIGLTNVLGIDPNIF